MLVVDMSAFRDGYRTFYGNCSTALADESKPIEADKFDGFYRSKHVGSVLSYLAKFGFILDGFDEDGKFSELQQLSIRFPASPRIMNVLEEEREHDASLHRRPLDQP